MSLLETIKKDQFEARKSKDAIKASLLTTLYSEASMIGKNAGNRETTDDETIKVIQKFLKGVNETIAILEKANNVASLGSSVREKEILEAYLPKMATEAEVRATVSELKAMGATNIGEIMKLLKLRFGSALDGKMASQLAKE